MKLQNLGGMGRDISKLFFQGLGAIISLKKNSNYFGEPTYAVEKSNITLFSFIQEKDDFQDYFQKY